MAEADRRIKYVRILSRFPTSQLPYLNKVKLSVYVVAAFYLPSFIILKQSSNVLLEDVQLSNQKCDNHSLRHLVFQTKRTNNF